MFVRIIFLLVGLFFFSSFLKENRRDDHAIYISVIKIKHETTATKASVNMRVFADDLKSVLRNKFGYESITEGPTFCSDYGQYILQYFVKQFSFEVNKAQVKLQLTNCQRLEEVYQLAFEMDCPKNWQTVKIEAPFFMELFPNQSNVIHIEDGDTKRMGRATKGKELLRFLF